MPKMGKGYQSHYARLKGHAIAWERLEARETTAN
jgi:hypothetical protein